jgi:hypothetical protein
MQAYGPAIGLLLAIAVGILAWFLAPEVDKILIRSLPNFREIAPNTLRIFTTVVMFIVFVLLVSLIVAAAVPKKKSAINEKGLIKEREDMIKEKKMTKLRRQHMNRMNRGE